MIRRILCFLVIAGVGCQRPKQVVVIPAEPQRCRTVRVNVYETKTDAYAAIYADRDLTTPLPNPMFFSCDESPTFWVAGNSRVVAETLR